MSFPNSIHGFDSRYPLQDNNYISCMSKKKKKKTRKQKQRAQIHKIEHLEKVSKEVELPTIIKEENTNIISKPISTKTETENKFTISNIKRSIIYTLFFFIVIAVLYILELNFHYFSDLSNNLISLLTR